MKGAQQPPSFQPKPIVATVAHLSYCRVLVQNGGSQQLGFLEGRIFNSR